MNTQKGFVHVVLITGLAIALIGSLGFVFWQNFIHKEPLTTKTVVQTITKKQNVVEATKIVHIPDLGLYVSVPVSLGDLTSEWTHLEGDQAVNSVVLSSIKAEAAGCDRKSAPLGYLTYDTDKGGVLVAEARNHELYYLAPSKPCDVITAEDVSNLKIALKSLISDYSDEKTAR